MKTWRLWMLCMLVSGCSLGPQFYCPPIPAYTPQGKLDPEHYRVNVQCYKRMVNKVRACYRDAE